MRKITFIIVLLAFTMASCTKNFDADRNNPNGVEDATPASFLAPVLYGVSSADINRAQLMGNELVQYTVLKGDVPEFHRYVIHASDATYFWQQYYRYAYNVQDMYRRAVALGDNNYVAVALTLRAWIFSHLTDMFGDVPYSDALKGDSLLLPTFDRQQDIYPSLLAGLDSAADLFATSGTLDFNGPVVDILYAGDVNKWRKFCNSLRLRLYLRVSKRPEMNSAAKIATIAANSTKYPIFTSTAEEANLNYTNITPFFNPFFTTRNLDFSSSRAPSEFILDALASRNDPRLPVWYLQTGGKYIGVPSAYLRSMDGVIFATATSALNTTLQQTPRLGQIMSYAEVEFILAEAALNGWVSGDPATYYNNGIQASMQHWGVSLPADYLAQPNVAFDGQLSTILLQKYLAQFFVGFESWFEFRRTGLPVLPVGPGAQNDGKMPTRLPYPIECQNLNSKNYQAVVQRIGGDAINIPGWWEK